MVYKPEGDETPSTYKRIFDALSLAGLRKSPTEKKPKTKTYPPPRKLAVQVVDGKSGAVIRANVPVYRLMGISSHAKLVLEANPRACRYKIYGRYKIYWRYKPASVCGVLEAITWLQPIPTSATILVVNLFTYEACLRLGVSNNRIELKPLLIAIYKQISSAPIDQDILAFVHDHLGSGDPVFKHTGYVLRYQRCTNSVDDVKGFAKMVAKSPAMQKFMTQIDQNEKAQRAAFRARKHIRLVSDADGEVSSEPGSDEGKAAEVETVETLLDKITREKENDHKQKETLLNLLNDQGAEYVDTNESRDIEKTDMTEKPE